MLVACAERLSEKIKILFLSTIHNTVIQLKKKISECAMDSV